MTGFFKAYPFDKLALTDGTVRDTLGGAKITVRYDAAHRNARVEDARGETIATIAAYWFAWQASHPDTALFSSTAHKESHHDNN